MHPIPISSLLKASALAISLAASGFVHAGFFTDTPDETNQDGRFINRKSEGWFWYEVEPEPVEPVLEKKEEPKIVVSEQSKPEDTKPVDQGPAPLSAAWFRENLPKYKDAAWDNPTIENVKAYLYLQRFVMDRAEQFSDTWELAMTGDPFLDEISRRPSATFGNTVLDSAAGKAQEELISSIAKKAGIFFFFKSDCEMCEAQAPVIEMFTRSSGFAVVPVSTDGKPLVSGIFKDFRKDKGHAKLMGVSSLPATYLMTKDGSFESVGQGVMSHSELQKRVLIAAKRNGWVSDEEFNKTRPVLNLQNNVAEIVNPEDLVKLLSDNTEHEMPNSTATGDINGTNFVPPEQITEFFRKNLNDN